MKTITMTAMLSFASAAIMTSLHFMNISGMRNGFLIAALILLVTGVVCFIITALTAWSAKVKLDESIEQMHNELESFLKTNDPAQ